MPLHTTYSQARQQLASYLDRVTQDRDIVIINRRGKEKVAMIAASELDSLLETAYLLRSPANAKRLLTALERAMNEEVEPSDIDALRAEVNID